MNGHRLNSRSRWTNALCLVLSAAILCLGIAGPVQAMPECGKLCCTVPQMAVAHETGGMLSAPGQGGCGAMGSAPCDLERQPTRPVHEPIAAFSRNAPADTVPMPMTGKSVSRPAIDRISSGAPPLPEPIASPTPLFLLQNVLLC